MVRPSRNHDSDNCSPVSTKTFELVFRQILCSVQAFALVRAAPAARRSTQRYVSRRMSVHVSVCATLKLELNCVTRRCRPPSCYTTLCSFFRTQIEHAGPFRRANENLIRVTNSDCGAVSHAGLHSSQNHFEVYLRYLVLEL